MRQQIQKQLVVTNSEGNFVKFIMILQLMPSGANPSTSANAESTLWGAFFSAFRRYTVVLPERDKKARLRAENE